MVAFNNIPGNVRVPFFHVEVRPGGTPYISNARLLLPAQKLSTGDAPANEPVLMRDGTEDMLFGVGSMASRAYRAARRNAPLQEIFVLPLDDLGAGVAATGKIDVTDTLSAPAAVAIYIAGTRVRLGVLSSDADSDIATNLAAAINADTSLPLTAAVNGSTDTQVDLTARHKGTLGNFIQVDFGSIVNDGPLASTFLSITAMTGGSGDPDLQTAFGNLGDDEFDFIASPYSDATNLGRVQDLLNDTSGRWSYLSQLYGHYFTVHNGTVGELSTFGNTLNSSHLSVLPMRKFRSMPEEVAAAYGAQAALHLQTAPEVSRPLQSLELVGIKPSLTRSEWLTKADRQTLYFDGVSGYYVHRDGSVRIDRVVTTYQTNVWGDPDWSYLDVETMFQLIYAIRHLRTKITSTFPRHGLTQDNVAGLDELVDPDQIRETVIHAASELVSLGVIENLSAFIAALDIEIPLTDPNRVDVGLSLDHVNQLRIFAAAITSFTQMPQAA
jgi:phage tail sheath gpL-like